VGLLVFLDEQLAERDKTQLCLKADIPSLEDWKGTNDGSKTQLPSNIPRIGPETTVTTD